MTTDSIIQTRTNKQLEFNLGTFNIPTVLGLLTIIGMIWSNSAEYTKTKTEMELRIRSIETDRERSKIANDQRLADLMTTTSVIPNMTYRQTVMETNLGATNARIDRQADALENLRSDIAGIGTKIEVLTQRIELALPLRQGALNTTPPEPKN